MMIRTPHERMGAIDEVARERYALGYLISGSAGEAHQQTARAILINCGVVDPEADIRGYYPELFRPA